MTDEKAKAGPACNCLTCRMEESVRDALASYLDEKPGALEVADALARVMASMASAAEEAKGPAGFLVVIETFFNEFNANVSMIRGIVAQEKSGESVH